jgi:hypothetical protein
MRIRIIETGNIIEANSYCELLQMINEALGTEFYDINNIEDFVINPNILCEGTEEDVNCCLIIQYLIANGTIQPLI